MKNLFANVCLLLVSCVAGLALCEVSLRLFYPKYQHLAEGQFRQDEIRIWTRTSNSRDFGYHPDTLAPHTLHHNNLALRQHRNFSAADLAAATNIGVFGDSFTENTGLPVQYSFTEPLDYLLNLGGERFNVLNFGVNAYGPGQSLLHYESFRYAEDLDHVFYIYCVNDLENIYETGLFHLDEAGLLARNELPRVIWWRNPITRLHITYLVLDARGQLSSVVAERLKNFKHLRSLYLKRRVDGTAQALYLDHDVRKNVVAIFQQLIRHWKHLAEHHGATFSVVLLPREPPKPWIVDLLDAEAVEVVDLYDRFGDRNPAHLRRPWLRSPYRFKRDGHWNEDGNRLAAVCLYRFLEEKMRLPSLSSNRLREVIDRYYAAFEGISRRKALGGGEDVDISAEAAAAIREKYLALDISDPLKDLQEEVIEVVVQPDKRIIASDFNVYLDRNTLFYVKEECRQTDTEARFFLHVTPVDERHIHEHRRQYDFESLNFSRTGQPLFTGQCVVKMELPSYPIRQIHTGQFVKDAQGNYVHIWEGGFSMAQAVGVGEGGR